MKIKPTLGWNRINPPHELLRTGDPIDPQSILIQCSKLQNYVVRNNRIRKIGGTSNYNRTSIGSNISWVNRSYHKRGDGSFVKRTLAFSEGEIFSGDDVAGTLTSRQMGFTPTAIPLSFSFQVSGNSILYFFTGEDTPYKYDGNGSFKFEETSFNTLEEADDYESGQEHVDRIFYVRRGRSTMPFSESLTPEVIENEVAIGNARDSFLRRIVKGIGERVFIFKNNSIWELFGRTVATFQVRRITDNYGLASKRGIVQVGSGFVFLDEFTKELYFFGGTEASIKSLTERDIRLREIINDTEDALKRVDMTTHDGLFRFAFQHRESFRDSADSELIYPLNEPGIDGIPKWSLIRDSNVGAYSVWNQQGDREELVTGRSDTGKLMYHNRGFDFDGGAIETIMRTGEVTADEEFVMRFLGFYIKAKPGSANLTSTFRYFLNGRFSDRGEDSLSMKGETRDIGSIKLQKQALFNDRIIPLTGKNRGSSISFEIYDFQNGTDMEIYSISFTAKKLYKMRNQFI